MKALSKISCAVIFFLLFFNANAQSNCNSIQATGNFQITNNNYSFVNDIYFIPYSNTFAGTFNGSVSGSGVLNYAVHRDSIIVNDYSIIQKNINAGVFDTILPICDSYYISAIYGEDLNFDGIVDDVAGDCSIIFTSQPIMFYIPINLSSLNVNELNCQDSTTYVNFSFYGGISDCLDNENCESTYTINNVPNYCTNQIYTYIDPFTNDTVLNSGGNLDSLHFDFIDIDGSNYNYSFPYEEFLFEICPPGILSVELLNFKGIATSRGNELSWQTISEWNNDYFTIYKSMDGVNFDKLQIVNGNLNSNEIKTYYFVDETANTNSISTYYRLTQTDLDGTENSIKTINLKSKNQQIIDELLSFEISKLNDNIKINYHSSTGQTNFKIYDLFGNVVLKSTYQSTLGYNNKTFVFNNLPAGIYVFELQNSQFKNIEKFVW